MRFIHESLFHHHHNQQRTANMKSFTTITIIAVMLTFTSGTVVSGDCYRQCRFYFKASEFAISPLDAGRGISNIIYLRNEGTGDNRLRFGKALVMGEALEVSDPTRPVPISLWRPRGMTRRFTPTFFKPFQFPGLAYSGITYEKATQHQMNFLNERCWILPILKYQLIVKRNTVVRVVQGKDPLHDCIAFKSFVFN